MKKRTKVIFIILLSIFIILAIAVVCGLTQNIDNNTFNIMEKIRNENLTSIVVLITNLGGLPSLFFIMAITVIILFILKKRKAGIAVALNLIISSCTYVIMKSLIQRPRPIVEQSLIIERGYSFPSGHSTNNMAFYALAIYLVYNNVKNKKIRNTICIVLAIIPILIAFTRIYLGVHYLSDVIAGLCLGAICVTIFINYVYNRIKIPKSK